MRSWRLSTQILTFQAIVLTVMFALGLVLVVVAVQHHLDREAELRALAVARSVAAIPAIADAVAANDRSGVVDRQAEAIRRASGSSFVVVTDMHGVRFSHPNPKELLKRVSTSPEAALHGHVVLAVQTGTLGRSARAKVPLRLPSGRIVGEVSVGFTETTIQRSLSRALPVIVLYGLVLLGVGLSASLAVAAHLKRQTFGLELDTLSDLFREREAVLCGIREGVLAVDEDRRIRLVNESAERLLGVSQAAVGHEVDELANPQLAGLLHSADDEADTILVHDDRVLVANRCPVRLDGRDLGAVITVRDRTELERLSRQLSGVMTVTNALRAQAHEFSNRLHVIGGLLRLDKTAEALEYLSGIQRQDELSRHAVAPEIRHPLIRALLSAKSAVAAERDVEFHLDADSAISESIADPAPVLTILGNLVDNAIEAAIGGDDPVPWVEVRLTSSGDTIRIAVSDSGCGVPPEDRQRVFEFGHTTKLDRDGISRGVGLALVQRLVQELGGVVRIDAHVAGGATFEVVLPAAFEQKVAEGIEG